MNVLGIVGAVLAGTVARLALVALAAMLLGVPVLVGVHAARGFMRARERALGLAHVDGLVWKPDSYYAPGHIWVRRLTPERLRVGVDDLAQRVLTGASVVSLPPRGSLVREGDVAAIVRCGDKLGGIRSPVDGVVLAVNHAVERDPSLIHREPYARGWLYTVKPSNARYGRLLGGDRALAWLRDERQRLAHFLEGAVGIAAADGGDLVAPPPSLLTSEQWSELTQAFLLTGDRMRT